MIKVNTVGRSGTANMHQEYLRVKDLPGKGFDWVDSTALYKPPNMLHKNQLNTAYFLRSVFA